MKKVICCALMLITLGLTITTANAAVFFNFSFSDCDYVPVEEYVVERVRIRPVRYRRYYREYYPEEYCYDYYAPRTYYRDYYWYDY